MFKFKFVSEQIMMFELCDEKEKGLDLNFYPKVDALVH
jgi:hypothetical protein